MVRWDHWHGCKVLRGEVLRLGAPLMALAVVRISLEHLPVRIGILIVLLACAVDIVHAVRTIANNRVRDRSSSNQS